AANGDWIGTAYGVSDYKSLPPAVNTVINDKFPGYTISTVNREMQKDKMAYEIQLKNGDAKAKVLIDDNGNIIKQKTVEK
ncbi:MAG TPA: PepSY-like domain-containing protein, partial [Chitinophagaceae bacterium]|nr:PepSY-like domain-containing protein [Chitinophagaceae bacterium]